MNRRQEVKYAVSGELQEITFSISLFFYINMIIVFFCSSVLHTAGQSVCYLDVFVTNLFILFYLS